MGTYSREEIEYMLKNYFRWKKQRDNLQEQVERFEAIATKMTPSYDPNKGNVPIDNPKSSKVEKNAIKIAEAKEKIEQLTKLIDATDELLRALRPHQRYLLKCCVANGMDPKDFARREGLKNPAQVKVTIKKLLDKLENV